MFCSYSGLFNFLRLAGRAHGVLSHSLEFLPALLAFVILPLHTIRWDLHVYRASDCAHTKCSPQYEGWGAQDKRLTMPSPVTEKTVP